MKLTVFSPGRANLIGEHTDYNDGFVLPFAINRYVRIDVEPSKSFRIYSEQTKKGIQFERPHRTGSWADYVIGVVAKLIEHGYDVKPFSMRIDSDLPMGAGLSSSAALEVGAGLAIATLMGYEVRGAELAAIAHEAEVEFVGVRCGIMDQYTVALAKSGFALFLDTMTREYRHVPLHLGEAQIYLLDSGVKHELASSEYNKRRSECERALQELGKRSFRDVTFEDIETLSDPVLRRRALHVLSENERVLKVLSALETDNLELVGKLLYESHYSLRDNYEVSCEETDFIVSLLERNPSVLGARIVGAGFGGSVIVLARPSFKEHLPNLTERYRVKFGMDLKVIEVEPSEGAHVRGYEH